MNSVESVLKIYGDYRYDVKIIAKYAQMGSSTAIRMRTAIHYLSIALKALQESRVSDNTNNEIFVNNFANAFRTDNTIALIPPYLKSKVEDIVDHIIKCEINNKSELDINARICYALLNANSDIARHFLKQCINKYPNEYIFHQYCGRLYGLRPIEELKEGLNHYNKALELQPNNCHLLYDKASHLGLEMNVFKPEDVINAYLKFIENAPKDHRKLPEAYYAMALLLLNNILLINDLIEIKGYYEKGLESERNQLSFLVPYESRRKPLVEKMLNKYGIKVDHKSKSNPLELSVNKSSNKLSNDNRIGLNRKHRELTAELDDIHTNCVQFINTMHFSRTSSVRLTLEEWSDDHIDDYEDSQPFKRQKIESLFNNNNNCIEVLDKSSKRGNNIISHVVRGVSTYFTNIIHNIKDFKIFKTRTNCNDPKASSASGRVCADCGLKRMITINEALSPIIQKYIRLCQMNLNLNRKSLCIDSEVGDFDKKGVNLKTIDLNSNNEEYIEIQDMNGSDVSVNNIGIQCDDVVVEDYNQIDQQLQQQSVSSGDGLGRKTMATNVAINKAKSDGSEYLYTDYPEYVMFGTFRSNAKIMECNCDGIKFRNVSPNNTKTNFKYYITIPFIEMQELLYCNHSLLTTIFVKPIKESNEKINECMSLSSDSANGFRFHVNSEDIEEHYIIAVMKYGLSDQFLEDLQRCAQNCNPDIHYKRLNTDRAEYLLQRVLSLTLNIECFQQTIQLTRSAPRVNTV